MMGKVYSTLAGQGRVWMGSRLRILFVLSAMKHGAQLMTMKRELKETRLLLVLNPLIFSPPQRIQFVFTEGNVSRMLQAISSILEIAANGGKFFL